MRYLITGGTGFIGSNFIKTLSSQKDSVIVLSRQKKQSEENCTFISDPSLISDDEKIDCIINLAGKPIDCRWTKSVKKELKDSRLSVTKSLAKLLERLKVRPEIVVSASAVGFYGDVNNQTLDEYAVGKNSFTQELCQEWENEALKLEQYGVRVCLMRLGVVLGKNGGFIKKVSVPFSLGLGGRMGHGEQIVPWIHMDDVMDAIKFIIENKKCSGPYNFVAPETTTNNQITKNIGTVLNKPTILNIPAFLIKIIFGEMGASLLLQGNRIKPARLLEQGYQFKYKDAMSALYNIYRS